MTCEQMRTALLSADLGELQGTGGGDLAAHLKDCAACRADAQRILEGTMRLGAAIRGRARRRTTTIVVPLAVAAGIALLLFFRPRTGVVAPVASSTATELGAPAVGAPGPMPQAPARDLPRRSAGAMARSTPVEAIPVVAVAYAAQAVPAAAAVAPDPARARRRTVLHPTDPNITVLWFE